MPFDVADVPFMSADFAEFVAAFVTMAISFLILVVLDKWWAR
jgi:hypothetical protein